MAKTTNRGGEYSRCWANCKTCGWPRLSCWSEQPATGSMWFRPTLEVERDRAVQYGAVPERRTDRLEGHAATTPTPNPSHASGHSTAMATRQSLDLAAQACALVFHSVPERPLRRHPVLLSAHRSVDLEAIREWPRVENLTLESWVGSFPVSLNGYSEEDLEQESVAGDAGRDGLHRRGSIDILPGNART